MKSKWVTVAWWEYITKVRTKTFLLSLIVTPVFLFGLTFVPSILATRPDSEAHVVGVIDRTGEIAGPLDTLLRSRQKLPDGQPAFLVRPIQATSDTAADLRAALDLLVKEKIVGYLIIPASIMKDGKAEYRSQNVGNLKVLSALEGGLKDVVVRQRMRRAGVDPGLVEKLDRSIDLTALKVSKTGEAEEGDFMQLFLTSLAFIIAMFFLIITTGQMLLRSTIEEKSNRIIEVLVSSSPSLDLMAGKIIGLSMLGITQVAAWAILGLVVALSASVVTVTLGQLALFLLYFILGYLFISAIFVAVGSVLTTEQEAQQWTGYLSMIFTLPLVFIITGVENPNSPILRILEFVPFFTPMIMAQKIPLTPIPAWEIGATVLVLVASVILSMWVAGKIFRVGILITGKRPSFDEVVRWFRSA